MWLKKLFPSWVKEESITEPSKLRPEEWGSSGYNRLSRIENLKQGDVGRVILKAGESATSGTGGALHIEASRASKKKKDSYTPESYMPTSYLSSDIPQFSYDNSEPKSSFEGFGGGHFGGGGAGDSYESPDSSSSHSSYDSGSSSSSYDSGSSSSDSGSSYSSCD